MKTVKNYVFYIQLAYSASKIYIHESINAIMDIYILSIYLKYDKQ